MEVLGNIHFIGAENQVSASFKNRQLVVKTDEQYPQFISVTFVQDKCDLLNGYKVGQTIKVSINLRGREWTNPQGETKYFNDIQGWRIETVASEQQKMPPAPSEQPPSGEEEDPNLPF